MADRDIIVVGASAGGQTALAERFSIPIRHSTLDVATPAGPDVAGAEGMPRRPV